MSSYLRSHTHIQTQLWRTARSLTGANEGQTLPDALNHKNIGFQIHPRLMCVSFLASVTLHVSLHAKLHQAAMKSKQVPLVCCGIKSVNPDTPSSAHSSELKGQNFPCWNLVCLRQVLRENSRSLLVLGYRN